MKPIVLMDVDGVCADFTGHLLNEIDSRFTIEDVVEWDIFKLLETEGKKQAALSTLAIPDFWASIPPIEGAQAGIERIRLADFEVIFLTSPWLSTLGWGEIRRGWLQKHFGAQHNQVIITSRKELVHGAHLIDDKAENVLAWQARWDNDCFQGAMLFDQPYNRHVADLPRINWSLVDGIFPSKLLAEGV